MTHLKRLHEGVEAWNLWRASNLVKSRTLELQARCPITNPVRDDPSAGRAALSMFKDLTAYDWVLQPT